MKTPHRTRINERMCQTRCIFFAAILTVTTLTGLTLAQGVTTNLISSRWPDVGNAYLYDNNGTVSYNTSHWGDEYSWIQESYNGHVRIKNKKSGNYMNIQGQKGVVECTAIQDSWLSAQWTTENIDGFVRFNNFGTPGMYITVEGKTGNAQYLAAKADWWSAEWSLIETTPVSNNQTSGHLIGDGIARFFPSNAASAAKAHFVAFIKHPDSIAPVSSSEFPTATFTDENGKKCATVSIEDNTSLYGTGEVAGSLRRNNSTVETWNTDMYGYMAGTQSLYQSHPWVLAVRADGTAYGVLAATTYRCKIDLKSSIKFSADGPAYPVIIVNGATPQDVLKKLATLIGTIEMPPLWALGFQQCRYSYYPDTRVKQIADTFRVNSIPCDVIWMDIDYMDGYRVFTFDQNKFPYPDSLNSYLHKKGFKSVWMIDPGVEGKTDNPYWLYTQGNQIDAWVKNADGSTYRGKVWPDSLCAFPDFTNSKVAIWWAGLYKDFMAKGIDGVWNDMNEPSVPGSAAMPNDARHTGGVLNLEAGTHAQYHNIYGMLMVKASREGILAANKDKRPFVLSRSNFLGGQRYAATWTGDNTTSWDHLRLSVPMVLNLGLSGQPFTGPDIGGFIDNGTASLFARWIGVGALFPFSRAHTQAGNRNKEPWAWDDATTNISRTALNRRYCLLPYLYSLFYESSLTGLPVMRPVFFADLTNAALRTEDKAFLLGANLLVVPNLYETGGTAPAEPRGIWRPFTLVGENPLTTPAHPVLKIRGGAIIPTGQVVQNTTQEMLDTLTLYVCLDSNNTAKGDFYEDAKDGFAYKQGQYLNTHFIATPITNGIKVSIQSSEGSLTRPKRVTRVKLVTRDSVSIGYGDETAGVVAPLRGMVSSVDLKKAPLTSSLPKITIAGKDIIVNATADIGRQISVFDLAGRAIVYKISNVKTNDNSRVITHLHMPSRGVYFVRILEGDQRVMHKIVIK